MAEENKTPQRRAKPKKPSSARGKKTNTKGKTAAPDEIVQEAQRPDSPVSDRTYPEALQTESGRRLTSLLEHKSENLMRWYRGYVPKHYKRLTIPMDEAIQLADVGARELYMAFGDTMYFTQSLIAGAVLSDKYDTVTIVSCSQYGKSYLMARIGLLRAYYEHGTFVAAADEDGTRIIMQKLTQSLKTVSSDIRSAMLETGLDKLEKLNMSLSKKRIAFRHGGFVEPITLGASFEDVRRNKAVGRAADFIVDEAAFIPESAMVEMGRRELASVDGHKDKLVMISNPHRRGYFYDKLTADPLQPGEIVIWMDALTALEEGRWTAQQILTSEFAKHDDTLTRYWLCELPGEGAGMFTVPIINDKVKYADGTLHFLGVDAAYKGKDNIEVCHGTMTGGKIHIEEIATIDKGGVWIDGVTSHEIVHQIATVYRVKKCCLICVDVGYGVWLVEGLARQGCNVRGINFGGGPTKARVLAKHYAATNAQNMRAELHLDLQSLMEEKLISFTTSAADGIKDPLPYITSERKTSGKIQIRPKIEVKNAIGHSPDKLDAVLLMVHAAILYTAEEL